MSKKMASTLPNMILVLTLISVVAALALGVTYGVTKDAIEKTNKMKVVKAIKDVVPPFDNNPVDDAYTVPGFDGLTFYPAKMNGQLVGTAVKTFTMLGYAGEIDLMIGFDKDNKITGSKILMSKETPGLGTKLGEDAFKTQFLGKDPAIYRLAVKKDGGDVDAITAATISSRAFCDAVKKAYDGLLKGGKK